MTLLDFMRLFEEFRAASWDGWRVVLARLLPSVREFYVIAGRGAGKSRIIALLACCFATRAYTRAPGENIYIGVAAPDRKQAGVTFRYIVGMLNSVPSLAALIVAERGEAVELSNGVIIEVVTASTVAPRGRAFALFIVEESAFLPSDSGAADPDIELLRAVRPALARVPGSLLAVIGSPYARRGVLYEAWRDGDGPHRVVVTSDTASLNPTFDAAEIARAFRDDPTSARSEYGADGTIVFRSDVSTLLADSALAAVVQRGVHELAPERGRSYHAHLDAATGSGEDSAALAVAFHDGTRAVLAAARRWTPPFSPASMAAEAAIVLRRYGVGTTTIDAFAPGLVADLLRREGVTARPAGRDTSTAFVDLLAVINSDQCRLLDEPALLGELSRLERKPGSSGRDRVGHPPRGHDDVAAAAAFAITNVTRSEAKGELSLLFAGSSSPIELAMLEVSVESLRARLAGGARAAAASLRTAGVAVAGALARLRQAQRTPEQSAARKAEADRLRALRRVQDVERLRGLAAAQQLEQRRDQEHAAERDRRMRAEQVVLTAIVRRGVFWPGD